MMIKIILLSTVGDDYETCVKYTYVDEIAEQLYAQMLGWA